jgi:hypothetical protein
MKSAVCSSHGDSKQIRLALQGKLYISLRWSSQTKSYSSTPLDTLLSEVEFDCLIRTPVLAQLECRWERKSIYEADVEWGYSAVSYDNYQRIARSSFSGSLPNNRRPTLRAHKYG